jgi:hypothetical protein
VLRVEDAVNEVVIPGAVVVDHLDVDGLCDGVAREAAVCGSIEEGGVVAIAQYADRVVRARAPVDH